MRFAVKNTEWGAVFFDLHEDKALSLKEVLGLLNKHIPPKLPDTPFKEELMKTITVTTTVKPNPVLKRKPKLKK